MTNSCKKTPISGNTTCESEKKDKQLGHRRTRRTNKVRLRIGIEPLLRHQTEEIYTYGKDGKAYYFMGLKQAYIAFKHGLYSVVGFRPKIKCCRRAKNRIKFKHVSKYLAK